MDMILAKWGARAADAPLLNPPLQCDTVSHKSSLAFLLSSEKIALVDLK